MKPSKVLIVGSLCKNGKRFELEPLNNEVAMAKKFPKKKAIEREMMMNIHLLRFCFQLFLFYVTERAIELKNTN